MNRKSPPPQADRDARRATWLAVALLVAWAIAFVGPGLPGGRVLQGTDLLGRFSPWNETRPVAWEAENYLLFDQAVQFFPWRMLTRALAAEELPPLWNPFAYAGSPLLANYQSASLAPVEMLVAGLAWERAPAVAAAIRLILAAVGMLLLLGALRLGPLAALFGALAFIGSGSITILLYHPNSNVSCLLPLVAYLSLRLARDGGRGAALGLALVMGAQYLGGHPESSLYVAIASVLMLLAVARPLRRRLPRVVPLFVAAHLLGVLLAAVQILPFLEYLADGAVLENRSGVLFASQPRAAAGIIAPQIFGTPTRPNTYFGPQNYHAVATQYGGLVTLLLGLGGALAWWGQRRRRSVMARRVRKPSQPGSDRGAHPMPSDLDRLPLTDALDMDLADDTAPVPSPPALGHWFWTAGLTALVAALLIYPTPLWWLATHVPLFRISANVTGLSLLFTFSLAIFGACGVEALSRSSAEPIVTPRGVRLVVLMIAIVATLTVLGWLLFPTIEDRLLAAGEARLRARYAAGSHYRPIGFYLDRIPLVVAAVRATLLWVGGLATAVALLIGGHRRLGRQRFVWLALLLLAIDLGQFGHGYVPAIEADDALPWNESIVAMRTIGAERVLPTGRAFPANTLTLWGIEDFRGHDAVGTAAHAHFFGAMTQGAPLRKTYDTYDRQLIDSAGIDLIASEEALVDRDLELVYRAARSGPTGTRLHLYRNQTAAPRVFIVDADSDEAEPKLGQLGDDAAIRHAQRSGGGGEQDAPGCWLPDAVAVTAGQAGASVAPGRLWSLVRFCYPGITRWTAASVAQQASVGALHRSGRPGATTGRRAVGGADLTRTWPVLRAREGQVTVVGSLWRGPLAVHAEVDLARPGLLVHLVQDVKGWALAVDDSAVVGARAWGLFQAIELQAGSHAVSWHYEPAGFAWGLLLSLSSGALILTGSIGCLIARLRA